MNVEPLAYTAVRQNEALDAELPRHVILAALKYANLAEGTSHMIPHEEVFSRIAKKRGWV